MFTKLTSYLLALLLLQMSLCEIYEPNQENISKFCVDFEWNYINFTWPSKKAYISAVSTKRYLPENNAMAGIKIYKDKIYIAMPRIRPGTPVTLGYISQENSVNANPLVSPFPSWEMNVQNDCATLQSVQSMEIDIHGIMWVIDGFRINNNTYCPPKLLLLDLNNNGRVVHRFTFPDSISLREGGFLNDIVVDDNFAYITDASSIDPGLIVYALLEDKAWKIRDWTMFAELDASNFYVDDWKSKSLAPIDGIALSPKGEERFVYYCALAGLNMYSINTKILKDEMACKGSEWRRSVNFIGTKLRQSDGLVVDNKGDLYYGLLPLYSVAKWNINEQFLTTEIVDQNRDTIIWPDSFAFDSKGYLYLLANSIHKFFDPEYKLSIPKNSRFRILKLFTGTNSYLHS